MRRLRPTVAFTQDLSRKLIDCKSIHTTRALLIRIAGYNSALHMLSVANHSTSLLVDGVQRELLMWRTRRSRHKEKTGTR
ncbi:hypothetical protein IF2G_09553 [Cordyceps javanica]|nr:hypothetical protein IF2G_09553 [Cordyceps javanica]